MIKNIFWDFDGVILDSLTVKDLGFRKIFKSYPKNLVEKLIHYNRINNGLSRFHKIEYFYNQLLKKILIIQKLVCMQKILLKLCERNCVKKNI